ncbi:hypothetical protein BVX97_01820 [bacterium E08(2017)]|nr:hypothetical protein BVX97_01820 [bacterium E08(2017)]
MMKTVNLALLTLIVICSFAQAQNTFLGGDLYVGDPASWSDAILPTSVAGIITNDSNGIIGNGSNSSNLLGATNLIIIQTGSTISPANYQGSKLVGCTWTVNGGQLGDGSLSINDCIITVNTNGTIYSSNNRSITIDSSTELTLNSGTFNCGDAFVSSGTAVFHNVSATSKGIGIRDNSVTINDGTWSISGSLGGNALSSGGLLNINGADINASGSLYFSHSNFDVYFGGNSQGHLIVDNFGGNRSRVSWIDINYKPGTETYLQLTNPVEAFETTNGGHVAEHGWSQIGAETGLDWAPALWADGRLTYDEQDYTTLGDWSTVTNWNGLGGYNRFSFVSNALSLAYEPPPSGTVIIFN